MDDLQSAEIPPRVNDVRGERFGRLTVVAYGKKSGRVHMWRCVCECGTVVLRRLDHMRSGRSSSCGCLNSELQLVNFQKHGGAMHDKALRHPLYSVWSGMKKRCYSVNCDAYKYYGGRGIGVSPKWREDFAAFAKDMGPRPEGCTLDRIDNDKDYGPENCRWADKSTQMKNRRPFARVRGKVPPIENSQPDARGCSRH